MLFGRYLESLRVRLKTGTATNLQLRDNAPGATRIHIEPNGNVDDGTVSKMDWMLDPYEDDPANYRIFNVFTKNGDGNGLNGENGAAFMGMKAAGSTWGVWPSLHVGFTDDGPASAVPMKFYHFDMSDTVWRRPMRGMWRPGRAATTGDYMLWAFKLYQAQNTATTGATPPTHAAGTVSDGAVNWLFVRDFQAALGSIEGCVMFGARDDMPMFGHSGCRVQYHAHTVNKNGFRQKWLSLAGTLLAWTGVRNDSDSYQIEMSDGSTTQFFPGWRRSVSSALALSTTTTTANSATPDVSNVEKLVLSNTGATTITNFVNGRTHQRIYVETTNANTTLSHNATIRLTNGAALLMGTDMVFCFIRHTDGRWVQVS